MQRSLWTTLLLTGLAGLYGCAAEPVSRPYGGPGPRTQPYSQPYGQPYSQPYNQPYYGDPVPMAPPPPVVEVMGVAPMAGYIWIGGYWNWGGARYVWVPGRWAPPRPGYVWVPHRWEPMGNHWVHRGGEWSHGPDAGPPRGGPRPGPRPMSAPAPMPAPAAPVQVQAPRPMGPLPTAIAQMENNRAAILEGRGQAWRRDGERRGWNDGRPDNPGAGRPEVRPESRPDPYPDPRPGFGAPPSQDSRPGFRVDNRPEVRPNGDGRVNESRPLGGFSRGAVVNRESLNTRAPGDVTEQEARAIQEQRQGRRQGWRGSEGGFGTAQGAGANPAGGNGPGPDRRPGPWGR